MNVIPLAILGGICAYLTVRQWRRSSLTFRQLADEYRQALTGLTRGQQEAAWAAHPSRMHGIAPDGSKLAEPELAVLAGIADGWADDGTEPAYLGTDSRNKQAGEDA